jgi:hypothetical protein
MLCVDLYAPFRGAAAAHGDAHCVARVKSAVDRGEVGRTSDGAVLAMQSHSRGCGVASQLQINQHWA